MVVSNITHVIKGYEKISYLVWNRSQESAVRIRKVHSDVISSHPQL
jgi:hypothetical protein